MYRMRLNRIVRESKKLHLALFEFEHSKASNVIMTMDNPKIMKLNLRAPDLALTHLVSMGYAALRKDYGDKFVSIALTPLGRVHIPEASYSFWPNLWRTIGIPVIVSLLTTLSTIWISGLLQPAAQPDHTQLNSPLTVTAEPVPQASATPEP